MHNVVIRHGVSNKQRENGTPLERSPRERLPQMEYPIHQKMIDEDVVQRPTLAIAVQDAVTGKVVETLDDVLDINSHTRGYAAALAIHHRHGEKRTHHKTEDRTEKTKQKTEEQQTEEQRKTKQKHRRTKTDRAITASESFKGCSFGPTRKKSTPAAKCTEECARVFQGFH